MSTSLEGKVAIITGSSSGIGLGIAKTLASQGCAIMVNSIDSPDQVSSLLTQLKETYTAPITYCQADVGTAEGCQNLIHQTVKTLGRVDILVNNAGIQYVAPIEAFPLEKWQAILNINLSSAFYTIHYALPLMVEQGFGRIINIASAHGLVGSAQKAAYVAAKHGILGLTKVVGLESAGKGVTCNALCPGWVLTPLVEKQIQERAVMNELSFEAAKKGLLLEKQPSGEFVTPEQIGAFVSFLCSEEAQQITGTALSIDGGWTAQ